MFPNGLIIFFRLIDANNNLASSVHPTGRTLQQDRESKFWEVLDDSGAILGYYEPDFIAAILPIKPDAEAPRAN